MLPSSGKETSWSFGLLTYSLFSFTGHHNATLGQKGSEVNILTKWLNCVAQRLRISLSRGSNRSGAFPAWRRKHSRLSKRSTSLKKLDDGRSPKRENYVSDCVALSSVIGRKFFSFRMFLHDSLIFARHLRVAALYANQCVTGVGRSVEAIVWPAVRDELRQLNTSRHGV